MRSKLPVYHSLVSETIKSCFPVRKLRFRRLDPASRDFFYLNKTILLEC